MRQTTVLAAMLYNTNALLNRGLKVAFKSEAEYVKKIKAQLPETENPQEYWFDATIDHFDNHGAGSPTYPMRYLMDDTYFDKDNGPIIFYAGNEGDVWTFWDNSGFMHTTLAQ